MVVPRQSQLYPGVRVNIVLKADQRTGKATTGQVADVLTRGDHPRGIKVRLADGQIGRVQSLSSSASSTGRPEDNPSPYGASTSSQRTGRGRIGFVQRDARDDGYDPAGIPEARSLADFIKFPEEPKPAAAALDDAAEPEDAMQKQLELEFPNLDTALVAAIVADYDDVEAARDVMRTLC